MGLDGIVYPILLWHQEHRSRAMLITIQLENLTEWLPAQMALRLLSCCCFFRKVNCCLFSPFPVVPGLVLVKNLKTLKSGIHGKTFAIDWIHIQAVLKLVEQNKSFRQLHHQHDSINPVQPVHQIHTIDVNLLNKSNLFSSFKPKFTQFVQYTLLIHSTQLRYLSLSGSWQFMQNRSLDPAKQHLGVRLLKST